VPLYEYICRDCNHPFEELVFGNESVRCPECSSARIERQLSVPAAPRTETTPLPSACNSSGPPCGPACRRWNGS